MPYLPLRKIAEPLTQSLATEWLEELSAALADASTDRALLCRRTLTALYYPEYAANWETAVEDAKLPRATRLALASMDPRNITLEPEYYGECDEAQFQRVKPLLWLWYSFDRSPLGGQNVWLGVELRRLLAQHIFKRCGENFKAFHYVEFSFGYNMEVGDDVVVHRHVLLDDRGGIVIGNSVSISDYANIYSHTHSIVEQRDVTNATTRDRRRRAHHLPRDGARRRARARTGHGRRDGGGDEGRAAVSRLRRHSGQERARQAERARVGRTCSARAATASATNSRPETV